MAYETLLTEIGDDFVAIITLNRAEQLNTFTPTLASELNDALLTLDGNDRVRVIIIKGAGKAFCAGIDVNNLFGQSAMQYREWIEAMERPLAAISCLKKPVIAQVHGVAAANGAGLVAACDLAVAADNARLGLTAINVGLNCVGPVIPVRTSIGRKRSLEMLFYGDLIGASQACEWGLLNKVVPAAELESATRQWAASLAARSPVATQISKTAYYASEDMSYHQAFAYMNEAFARLCTTDDAKEGVTAFFDKRQPDWQGK
ncbi:MAG: enoyl-CoA hydratase/isomerase family protein [Deltaproteobacteria bacterium]|nr:enoyl-CoA hydratase/isomerase family protein [Candidatus Anaeroferrophillus wilburensis]MBN2889255.1 enoyl-CoA hydratase/isomerase family protein [Deltaproteobacteria bacterium]